MKPIVKVLASRLLLSLVIIMASAPVLAAGAGRGTDRPAAAAGGTRATGSPASLGSAAMPGGNILQQAGPLTATNFIYLPLIAKAPPPGLYGRVTLNGVPQGGVGLALWRNPFHFVDTQNTAADGTYAFIGEPALAAGQSYYVLFNNGAPSADGRVKFWLTRFLSSYAAGQSVAIGNFDLADIALVSPASNVIVTVPTTFTWTTRAGIPSDTYQVRLFQFNGTASFTSLLLGYMGTYHLNSLPGGFSTNVQYSWQVLVNSPDGGIGGSYDYHRNITFSNSGQSAGPSAAPEVGSERELIIERLLDKG